MPAESNISLLPLAPTRAYLMMPHRFSAALVRDHVVTFRQMDEALTYQREHGGRLATILLQLHGIDEHLLVSYLGRTLGILPAGPELFSTIDPDVLQLLEPQEIHSLGTIPIGRHEQRILLLSADPPDEVITRRVEALVRAPTEVRLILDFRFHQALHTLFEMPLPARYVALHSAWPSPFALRYGTLPLRRRRTGKMGKLEDSASAPVSSSAMAGQQHERLADAMDRLAEELGETLDRDVMLQVFMDFAGRFADGAALLAFRRLTLRPVALRASALGESFGETELLEVSSGGFVEQLMERSGFHAGSPREPELVAVFDSLGFRAPPADALLVSIQVARRPVLLLAAYRLKDAFGEEALPSLLVARSHLGRSLERVAARLREVGVSVPTSMPRPAAVEFPSSEVASQLSPAPALSNSANWEATGSASSLAVEVTAPRRGDTTSPTGAPAPIIETSSHGRKKLPTPSTTRFRSTDAPSPAGARPASIELLRPAVEDDSFAAPVPARSDATDPVSTPRRPRRRGTSLLAAAAQPSAAALFFGDVEADGTPVAPPPPPPRRGYSLLIPMAPDMTSTAPPPLQSGLLRPHDMSPAASNPVSRRVAPSADRSQAEIRTEVAERGTAPRVVPGASPSGTSPNVIERGTAPRAVAASADSGTSPLRVFQPDEAARAARDASGPLRPSTARMLRTQSAEDAAGSSAPRRPTPPPPPPRDPLWDRAIASVSGGHPAASEPGATGLVIEPDAEEAWKAQPTGQEPEQERTGEWTARGVRPLLASAASDGASARPTASSTEDSQAEARIQAFLASTSKAVPATTDPGLPALDPARAGVLEDHETLEWSPENPRSTRPSGPRPRVPLQAPPDAPEPVVPLQARGNTPSDFISAIRRTSLETVPQGEQRALPVKDHAATESPSTSTPIERATSPDSRAAGPATTESGARPSVMGNLLARFGFRKPHAPEAEASASDPPPSVASAPVAEAGPPQEEHADTSATRAAADAHGPASFGHDQEDAEQSAPRATEALSALPVETSFAEGVAADTDEEPPPEPIDLDDVLVHVSEVDEVDRSGAAVAPSSTQVPPLPAPPPPPAPPASASVSAAPGVSDRNHARQEQTTPRPSMSVAVERSTQPEPVEAPAERVEMRLPAPPNRTLRWLREVRSMPRTSTAITSAGLPERTLSSPVAKVEDPRLASTLPTSRGTASLSALSAPAPAPPYEPSPQPAPLAAPAGDEDAGAFVAAPVDVAPVHAAPVALKRPDHAADKTETPRQDESPAPRVQEPSEDATPTHTGFEEEPTTEVTVGLDPPHFQEGRDARMGPNATLMLGGMETAQEEASPGVEAASTAALHPDATPSTAAPSRGAEPSTAARRSTLELSAVDAAVPGPAPRQVASPAGTARLVPVEDDPPLPGRIGPKPRVAVDEGEAPEAPAVAGKEVVFAKMTSPLDALKPCDDLDLADPQVFVAAPPEQETPSVTPPADTGEASAASRIEHVRSFCREIVLGVCREEQDALRRMDVALRSASMPLMHEAIAQVFPGPLLRYRRSPSEASEAVEHHGPLLAVLRRRLSLLRPMLRRLLSDSREDARYYALRLCACTQDGAFVVACAASRLLDSDPQIRQVALALVEEARGTDVFERALDALRQAMTGRDPWKIEHAAGLVAQLGDSESVESLIRLLDHPSDRLRQKILQALVLLTFADFGPDLRAWRRWWLQNRTRSRMEWMVDGMTRESLRSREAVARELRRHAGLKLQYDPSGDPSHWRMAALVLRRHLQR